MTERAIYFGDYIKDKRKNHSQQFTISQIAEYLGVSRAFYCDVENKRRAPFDGKRLEMLADYLGLTEDETATMFDLASHYRGNLPYDIENTLLHGEIAELAQTALRLSRNCADPEAPWKQLIRQLEASKAKGETKSKRGNTKGGDG
jgi:transcriptional regulator with XRE-family HTH domain